MYEDVIYEYAGRQSAEPKTLLVWLAELMAYTVVVGSVSHRFKMKIKIKFSSALALYRKAVSSPIEPRDQNLNPQFNSRSKSN
jgi:hypothetical protein